MLNAGDLNTRIEIQHRTLEQDEYGQRIESWLTFVRVWADVRHLSGLESIKSNIESSEVRVSMRIRYLKNVIAGMRVISDGQIYDIEAVMPDKARKEFIDLSCRAINHGS